PIFIFSPTSTDQRLEYLGEQAGCFVYCVARSGVTCSDTTFSVELTDHLHRCLEATRLPLAASLGVASHEDVEFLRGKSEIAVIGSQTIRVLDEHGPAAVGDFIRSLR